MNWALIYVLLIQERKIGIDYRCFDYRCFLIIAVFHLKRDVRNSVFVVFVSYKNGSDTPLIVFLLSFLSFFSAKKKREELSNLFLR